MQKYAPKQELGTQTYTTATELYKSTKARGRPCLFVWQGSKFWHQDVILKQKNSLHLCDQFTSSTGACHQSLPGDLMLSKSVQVCEAPSIW